MENNTLQPKLILAIDINLCGVGICYKNFKGMISSWLMLYCDTTNSRETQKCLQSHLEKNKITPDTIAIEAIYFSPIKDITKLFMAEGVVRGVLATLFPLAQILIVPSVSYKTHFKLAKGNHLKNKIAAVEYVEQDLLAWFGPFNKEDNRMHDMADMLLLCLFIEETWQ